MARTASLGKLKNLSAKQKRLMLAGLVVLAAVSGFIIYRSRAAYGAVIAQWLPNPAGIVTCVPGNTCHETGTPVPDSTFNPNDGITGANESWTGIVWECGAAGAYCWRGPLVAFSFIPEADQPLRSLTRNPEYDFKASVRAVVPDSKITYELVGESGVIYTSECQSPGGVSVGYRWGRFDPNTYYVRSFGIKFDKDATVDANGQVDNWWYPRCPNSSVVPKFNAIEKNLEHRIKVTSGKVRIGRTYWFKHLADSPL